MMKVSIIIVNYNKKKLLQNCLKSIENIQYDNYDVIIVDNGSTDKSLEFVRNEYAKHALIDMGYNSSFCVANNIGIAKALKLKSDAVILLNNDTIVDKLFLAEMVRLVSLNEKIGMIAAKILLMKQKNKIDSTGISITPDGLAKNRNVNRDSSYALESEEVFCPAGAAALYTRELLEDIKEGNDFFDEKYAFYFEELDLGWRARLRGWKCIYSSDAIVYHYKNATSGVYSKFIAFHTNRNIFYNIIKNYPLSYCIRALLLTLVRYPLLICGMIIGRGAVGKFQNNLNGIELIDVTIRGWWDVWINIISLLKQRRYIQKRKQVTKLEYARWFKIFGLSFWESLYK